MARKGKPPLSVVDHPAQPSRVDEMIQQASEAEAVRFIEAFSPMQMACESPIEELLMAALYVAASINEFPVHFMGSRTPSGNAPRVDQCVFVYQQSQIAQYRVDILIQDISLPLDIAPPRLMVVECDGHEFHERTKHQARRDKQRDRFFQSKGYKVLRFTGSEIWADPEACADEIIEQLAANDAWRNRAK